MTEAVTESERKKMPSGKQKVTTGMLFPFEGAWWGTVGGGGGGQFQ